MKRIISSLIAGVMVFGVMSVPVIADTGVAEIAGTGETEIVDTNEPVIVDEIPEGIHVPATSFDPKTSNVKSWAVKEKTVTVTRDSSTYSYNVDIDKAGVYDLYVFYSTRAGTVNMVFSMDGNPAEAIEVPEAKGWAYGVGKVKLRGMELTEGKHTLTFAFDNSDYKYYFLESFTLVPRNK